MTNWINPLDKVPQVPQDYANHFIYGALLSWFVVLLVAMVVPALPMTEAWLAGFGFTLIVATAKKMVDYVKEQEPMSICLLKTVVTVLFPAWVVVAFWLSMLPGQ